MLQSLVGYFSRMTAGWLLGSFQLPVNIQTQDGLSWSEDGKLAVTTKKGVYVFEITPNARGTGGGPKARNTKNTIHFVKTFVEADVSSQPSQLLDCSRVYRFQPQWSMQPPLIQVWPLQHPSKLEPREPRIW